MISLPGISCPYRYDDVLMAVFDFIEREGSEVFLLEPEYELDGFDVCSVNIIGDVDVSSVVIVPIELMDRKSELMVGPDANHEFDDWKKKLVEKYPEHARRDFNPRVLLVFPEMFEDESSSCVKEVRPE